MTSSLSLVERRSHLEAARESLAALGDVLFEAGGAELAELTTLVDDLAARAGAARAVLTAEAVRRGEISTTHKAWVCATAPSLRQGGAGHLAHLAAAVGGFDRSLTDTGGPDPKSTLGIVWAAVTGTEATVATVDGDSGTSGATTEGAATDAASGEPSPITPALGLAVLSEMRALEPRLVPAAVPTVTRALVALGREWGAAHMRRMRPFMLATYGLQGALDDLQERLRPGAFLSSPEVESGELTSYRMALTPEQAATLEAVIGPPAKPIPNPETGQRDLRPAGQRRAESLVEVCRLGAGALSESASRKGDGAAGSWTAVHVTMTLADLRAMTGATPVPGSSSLSTWRAAAGANAADGEQYGTSVGGGHGVVIGSTADGVLLSPESLRRIACGADLIPSVLGSAGEVLDQGRVLRLFTKAQRRRLLLRDRHCTFPGCEAPGTWCRAHHVKHWFDHGPSDLGNGALLCARHHDLVHTLRLWAQVLDVPDERGRSVVWDVTPGSYDLALDAERRDRALNDPPPFTPERRAELLRSCADPAASQAEVRWITDELAWAAQSPPCCADPRCDCQVPVAALDERARAATAHQPGAA